MTRQEAKNMTKEKAETWWEWRVWDPVIRPVAVVASTKHTVTVIREMPEGRIINRSGGQDNETYGIFPTYAEAKRYAINYRKRSVADCEDLLESARQRLAQAMALPDEPPSP